MATEEAAVATYASRLDLQRAMIAQAPAAVESAKAELTRTQQDYKRYVALMASDVASRQRFREGRKPMRARPRRRPPRANAALAAAKSEQRRVCESQSARRKARLQQARAKLQARPERSRQHGDPRARSPGIAGNRAGQIGQYVKPGTQLLSLVPLPRVYVTANFKETQLT